MFQRAGQAAGLRDWYAEHLGIDIADWGGKPFEWTPGGSTNWAVFDHDTEYFGRPEQAFMVNFRVADLDAMLAQLRSGGVEVIDALDESEYGRFGWAVDPGRHPVRALGASAGPLTADLHRDQHELLRSRGSISAVACGSRMSRERGWLRRHDPR